MQDNKDEIFSYDLVPYRSWPYAQSHPDRLATIATLFGMEPQPIDQARVLELGCAGGGNIIPMAEMFPNSQFVGVDLSERQLSEGHETLNQLGLKNIELRQLDILDIDRDIGKFHYIIAHGVFSWVPYKVQEKILTVCRDNLESNGVAYVSYNTYPGWHMRGMIRDMVSYHVHRWTEPEERVAQARALLRFLTQSVARNENSYGAYLAEELELFGRVEDNYLLHDHLEKFNEPLYFWQFVQRADAHGLRYLGEADFSSMFANNLREGVASTLERITEDIIQMEQYLDFVRNRTFRQTLLCHAENSLQRTIGPKSIESLFVASRLTPASDQLNVHSADPARFSNSKVTIETNSMMVKAALIHLADKWPGWVPFQFLLHAARSQIRSGPVQDAKCIERDGQELAEQLVQFYASGAIELHAAEPQFNLDLGDRPVASPLARLQAESSSQVTNRRGETITLAELSWHAIRLLDGSRNCDEILDALVELVDKNILIVQTDGEQVRDLGEARNIIGEAFQRELAQLSKCALLVG